MSDAPKESLTAHEPGHGDGDGYDPGPGQELRPPRLDGTLPAGLPRRVHLCGIGGAGVSGAARLLAARGHRLSGHDPVRSPLCQGLETLGVQLSFGPSRAEDLPADAELVVRSAAVPESDPQIRAALDRGLPVLKYAQVLRHLAPPRLTLAVAGTHGKTTTSWMLARALEALWREAARAPLYEPQGADARRPGALVGGIERGYGTNALVPGAEGWFVLEACEYDRSFLELDPFAAVIGNVDADHLDCYGDYAGVERAFAAFAARVHPAGLLVLGESVPAAVEQAARCRVWRLGRELEARIGRGEDGRVRLEVLGRSLGGGAAFHSPEVDLALPGKFNGVNAALALALALGVWEGALESPAAVAAAARGLADCPGAARRFEPWGEVGGVRFVHDYAHHPTEVAATLQAAREAAGGLPVEVLFQPHQFSRTAHFLEAFARALSAADRIVVADVYGARAAALASEAGPDAPRAGAEELVGRLAVMGARAEYGGPAARAAEAFAAGLERPCLALVIGAGDIENVRHDLLHALAVRGRAPSGSLR